MKLPNPERAIVDAAKLHDYCLNPAHLRGRHKARVFASVLGLAQADAETLRRALLNAAMNSEATPGEKDRYGQRFVLDFEMAGPKVKAVVRSLWMVRAGEDFARLLTCFLL
jgi:hypothetical protein